MATTYTANMRLQKPAHFDRGWDVPINANADALDAMAPIAGLAVTPAESPSASLAVRVTPGTFMQAGGTVASYAGGTATLPANSTVYLWLTDAGVLATGSAWPATSVIYLAVATTGASAVASIADARVTLRPVGGPTATASGSFLLVTAGTTTPNARTLAGTANQVILADNGPGGTLVLSLPQSIAASSSVAFAGLTISGSASLATLTTSGLASVASLAVTTGAATVGNLSSSGTSSLTTLAVSGVSTFTGAATFNAPTTIKGIRRNVATKTANYTVVGTDDVIRADATSGPVTITLPVATAVGGMEIRIKKIDGTANQVSITSASSIDGAASVAIATQNNSRTLIADATSGTWNVF